MSEPIQYDWVIGLYEGGMAKHVLALADSGQGYFVLERGGNDRHPNALVAFRFAKDRPPPEHLTVVRDPVKIAEYEKRRKDRQGLING